MARMPTVLCLDVEDLVDPAGDDAALWTAQILSEYGLPGSIMVVGEKARLWETRGRQDVIEATKKHHVGYHSTWHSVHPATTEICLDKDLAGGMDALWEWDGQGWEDTERIIGRPLLGWACTGCSWSPSVMGLMGRMGRAYAYSYVRLPGHNVCWYANCLGFYQENIARFDDAYYDEKLFSGRLAQAARDVDAYVRADRQGARWLCFFMCHPSRIIHKDWWDSMNFLKGANPPRSEWKPAPRHPESLIPTMQANFRRLCEYVKNDTQLEVVGWGDLIARFGGQRAGATHKELLEIARRIADERQVLFTDHFTAAEILLMLCRAAVSPAERYERPFIFGPLKLPPYTLASGLSAVDVKHAASEVLKASQSQYLPEAVLVADERVGIGTYFVALAEALLGKESVFGPAEAPYPPIAEAISQEVAYHVPQFAVHPDHMDLSNLLLQTRLQCWALKPAWEKGDL